MAEKKLKVLDVDTPSEIVIKPSQVEPHKYGIWCKQLIKEGTKFGPFVGEKAYEVDETMDPAFIWEIVDVETKEFLFYINATNPRYGNWMRHINCARFFEEQNIVSEQEGIDIYYHAIKDIHPGEELLTWYEKSPVRRKKGKKKIFPNVKRARTGDESKIASKSSDYDSVSLRGRKRTARKFWEMEEVGVRSSTVEGHSSSEDDVVDNVGNHDEDDNDEDWDAAKYGTAANVKSRNSSLAPTAASSVANSISSGQNSPNADSSQDLSLAVETFSQSSDKNKNEKVVPPDYEGPHFHFESMVDQGGNGGSNSSTGGSWKNGRRVFRCDICSGIYRHSFSLKRHYVRCHINFKYLSKVDIVQCGVQPPKTSSHGDFEEESTTQNSSDAVTPGEIISEDQNTSQTLLPKDRQKSLDNEVTIEQATCSHKKLMPDMYRCNICEQFFDTKEELRYHLSNHPDPDGGGQRQFSCSHCKMQFKHRQNLVRHEVVHTGAKPFSCQQCHKSFPTATNQKRHERIHDGHRLTCDLCPASFTQTGDLKKHASKQHPESYNECAYCSKYFSSESALDAHLKKTHGEDVEANRRRVCVKKKEKKVLLEKDRAESRRLAIEEAEKRHSSRGSSEESYACTVCRKCFHNYSNMCRHRRLAHYKDAKVDDLLGMEDEEELGKMAALAGHQVHSSCAGGQQTGVLTRSAGVASLEIGYKHFLAVARNIPKNLELYIEGTQQDLENAKHHIKWKVPEKTNLDGSESDKLKENKDAESVIKTIDVSLEEYNFPKGFQISYKHNISETEEILATSETQNSSEDGQHVETKRESDDNAVIDKSFMKLCSHCKMNFADEKGYGVHILSCPITLAKVSPKQRVSSFEDVHDYSKKANPKEEAYKVFPELAKLPTSLFSDEQILDLSKHKNCVYKNSISANGMSFPCSACPEEPLDLTGSTGSKNFVHPDGLFSPQLSIILPDSSSANQDKSCTSREDDIPPQAIPSAPLIVHDVPTIEIKASKKIICLVCYMVFVDKEMAIEHQEVSHGNVDCRCAEVDNDFEVSMLKVPKPVGLLGSSQIVLSTSVSDKAEEVVQNIEKVAETEKNEKEIQDITEKDENEVELKDENADISTEDLHMTVVSEVNEIAEDGINADDAVVCTKCKQKFANLSSLHGHISENCGDYWRNLSERVSWVFVLRGNLVQPEQEQATGSNQPKKRGKFKWQQTSNPPLVRSNSGNEESTKKQNLGGSNCRGGAGSTVIDSSRKLASNKVLTRKRSQEIGAAVMSAMEDPDYYVRNKRRAIMQQNLAIASKKGMKRQTSLDMTTSKASLAEGSDSNQANSSLDEETLANLSGDGFNEDNNDDDDDYDPNKFMCIYCRHQFQYTRTLRKHVLEFCHVRREYIESGEDLDVEWEEELASKVQPPQVTPCEASEENEDTKKSGGRKKKRKSWYPRGYSNNQKLPPPSQAPEVPDKHCSYLPVQLHLPLDQLQQLREGRIETLHTSNPLVPMTTPGGTLVVKADDFCNGEGDLMVSCESIPHEEEMDSCGSIACDRAHVGSSHPGPGNCHEHADIPQDLSINLIETDHPQQLPLASPKLPIETCHLFASQSSPSCDFNLQTMEHGRYLDDDDEEEEDADGAMGLMMTVTSSPAAKHTHDQPTWELKRKSEIQSSVAGKKQKLSRNPDLFHAVEVTKTTSDPPIVSQGDTLF